MSTEQIIEILQVRLKVARDYNNPTEITFLKEVIKMINRYMKLERLFKSWRSNKDADN